MSTIEWCCGVTECDRCDNKFKTPNEVVVDEELFYGEDGEINDYGWLHLCAKCWELR